MKVQFSYFRLVISPLFSHLLNNITIKTSVTLDANIFKIQYYLN